MRPVLAGRIQWRVSPDASQKSGPIAGAPVEVAEPEFEPSNLLNGFRVAALVEDHFEQMELTTPKAALELAGAHVDLISRHPRLTGMSCLIPGDVFVPDVALEHAQARPELYDALLLPGGVVNGDDLRGVPEAQNFARALVGQGKPVAMICHAGWLLISAGLVSGRTLTSWPSMRDDFTNAGARWVDRPVMVDGNWISCRKPTDVPAFTRAMLEVFIQHHGAHQRAA